MNINDLEAGEAGEHLVCADLITQGYKAFLTRQGFHYDVVVDFNNKLIRIQVKTSRKPKPGNKEYKTKAYLYNVRRMGKNGRKQYKEEDTDVFAFVALDIKKIAYVKSKNIQQTMVFREEETKIKNNDSRYFDEFLFKRCL